MPSDNQGVLAPGFLRRLEALRLLLRRGAGGAPAGGGATRQKGGVIEFASHRDYAPGDDPRSVDWFAYARTGKLVVKEFARDEVARLRVLLDASASMAAEDGAKWRRAQEIAAALAALALFARATAEVCVATDGRCERLAGADAEGGLPALLQAVARVAPGGAASPVASFAAARRGPWATALVSDLLDATDPRTALAAPPGGAGEAIVVQLLAPSEAHPAADGALALADSETARAFECVADAALRERYAAELAAHRERWARATLAAGGRFVAAVSDEPVEAIAGRVVRPVPRRGGAA